MAYSRCAQIVSNTAKLMGNATDAEAYAALATKIRDALNKKYFDHEHHRYAKDSQSASAMALVLGIAPDDQRQAVFEELVRNITEDRKGHVSTGIVGTRFLFEALHQGGRDDVAYAMVMKPDFPGWIHMLNNGATTAWESWDGASSRNHPALAVVDAWFYEAIGGITANPGAIAFDNVTIAPQPLAELTWAKVFHDTIRGRIDSNWKIEGDQFTLTVTIPVGVTATVIVPAKKGAERRTCTAGRYTFSTTIR
jgi:alpha-L-rhamnosidase